MIEDRIFGPLTLKQFISLAIGFGLSYLAYSNLPRLSAYLVIAVIVILALFTASVRFQPKHIGDADMKQYFLDLKAQTPPDEYRKMLERKIAELESQIQMRKGRGLPPDPKLEEVRAMLELVR
ncbi:MAG: hypothetical protein EXS59_02210 [Candidatus Taylorbacteria bacterium]|nr:hypothetical protein [Candidatus Taylorbacteria bacterium]